MSITPEEMSNSVINELTADTTSTENELDILYALVDGIVFNNNNEYKQRIVNFLNNKGYEANINMSNYELFNMLETFKNSDIQGDATINDVLEGKTFMNESGVLLTGNIPVKVDTVITPGSNDVIIDPGFYSNNIVIEGDANLVSSNILSGVNIFNVNGSFQRPAEYIIFEDYTTYTQTLNNFELFQVTIPDDGNYEVIAKLEILDDAANDVGFKVTNVNTNTDILWQSITGGGFTDWDISQHNVVSLSKNNVISIKVTKRDMNNGTTGGTCKFLIKLTRIY